MIQIITEKEFRTAAIDSGSKENRITGYALTFNQRYVLAKDKETGLDYGEVIDGGALDGADFSDCHLNVDHSGKVYARTRNGSLKYKIDSHGLFIDADLSGSDDGAALYRSVKSGLYDRMSFAFTVADESYDNNTRTRHIKKIDTVYDCAVVATPANPNTEIHARGKQYLESAIKEYNTGKVLEMRKAADAILDRLGIKDERPEDYRSFDGPLSDREEIYAKMLELRASALNRNAADDATLMESTLHSIQQLEKELISAEKRRAEVRAEVAAGNKCKTITKYGDEEPMEKLSFFDELAEKRSATNVAGMGNVIPSDIIGQNIRTGKNGMFDFVSYTNINHAGNFKVPYIADSDLTVNSHTENASITPAGTVPSCVTITHSEYECTLGYSYLGKTLAAEQFESIINDSLAAAMNQKLDSVSVAAVNALTWVKANTTGKNAVQWSTSGAPTLAEIIGLMKLLPEKYASDAKLFMNRATSLAIIENSTGVVLTPSDDSAASNGMYNISVLNGLDKLLGVEVVIDSNMSTGDILYGCPRAVHLNVAGGFVLNNWLDHDSLTEKMQIACAAGAACETGAFVKGSNSIS